MKKKITIEINGLNNSARAINNNSINLEKLMQIAGLSWEQLLQDITFEIEHDLPTTARGTSEIVAEAIENVIFVAIGKFQNEDIIYTVLGGKTVENNAHGLGCFASYNSVGYTYPSVGFLGCATKEIAEHFGTYFGMLITEAKFGDLPSFTIINSKYNN